MIKPNIKITRQWSMPKGDTFQIRPIAMLLDRYATEKSVDPFARNSRFATIRNDIDPSTSAHFHLDAKEFLNTLNDDSCDLILFDPPYSPRQVSELYKKLDLTVNMKTTQISWWSSIKDVVAKKVSKSGHVISFGWNTNGIGKSRGFEIVEILIVAHGSMHNDTLVVVEKKI